MLYREIIVVYSQIHTKHINTLCGQYVKLLNVKPGGTYSNQWALRLLNDTMRLVTSQLRSRSATVLLSLSFILYQT
jgi:hypothetical protein